MNNQTTYTITEPQQITLRDYFAGQAMAKMVDRVITNDTSIVAWAYKMADAMLAEREKTNDK